MTTDDLLDSTAAQRLAGLSGYYPLATPHNLAARRACPEDVGDSFVHSGGGAG
jgi:hypothetical protein